MLAFLSAGRVVTRKIWHLNFASSAEGFVFSSALGSVLVSLMVTGLTFIGQISSTTCWVLLATLLSSGASSLNNPRQWIGGTREKLAIFFSLSPLKTSIQIILGIIIFFLLSLAMAPAFSTDALVYHLAVPKAYLEAGGIINLPNNVYSFYPQHVEMLYLFAMALGTDHLAQLTGLGIAFLLLVSLHQNYRQKGSAKYALIVPAVFISTPAFFTVAHSAYVDLQAAAYTFLAFYAWENWRSRKQIGWFYLMTLFAGSALATKLTAIIALPIAVLGIILQNEKSPGKIFAQSSILIIGSLLIIMPWWGKNYFYTGNPFSPFFIQIFGGEQGMNWDLERSLQHVQYMASYGMGHGILDFLLLPINLTFFGQANSLKFDGQIGILYFLLIPALSGLRRTSMPMVVTFLIFMMFWFTQTQQARLLATPFAFLTILSIKGLEDWISLQHSKLGKKEQMFVIPVLILGLIFNTSMITKAWSEVGSLPYIFKRESREPFLMRQVKSYPLYLAANHLVENDEKILLVYMRNLGYLMDKPFFSDSVFEDHTLKEIIDEEVYAMDIINRLNSMGITHILFNHQFIFGKYSRYSPGEKGILKNFLAKHAQRILVKNEFFLYRFMLDLESQDSKNGLISIPLNH